MAFSLFDILIVPVRTSLIYLLIQNMFATPKVKSPAAVPPRPEESTRIAMGRLANLDHRVANVR